MSDVLTSKKLVRLYVELGHCRSSNEGMETYHELYDARDAQAEIDRLQQDNARYESGRVVLTGQIDDLKKKLSARLQQNEELRMAERLNVETVAKLQQERDELKQETIRLYAECRNWKQLHDADEACIADLEQRRRVVPPTGPHVHGMVLDRLGWICSVCHGWNHQQDSHCTHTHAVTKSAARTEPVMAMLPNDHHPGPRCSCRECQVRYPDDKPAIVAVDHEGSPVYELPAETPDRKECTCATYCMIAVGARFIPEPICRGLRSTREAPETPATPCPNCGKDEVGTFTADHWFLYGVEKQFRLVAKSVLFFRCMDCGLEFTGEDGERKRLQAVHDHLERVAVSEEGSRT